MKIHLKIFLNQMQAKQYFRLHIVNLSDNLYIENVLINQSELSYTINNTDKFYYKSGLCITENFIRGLNFSTIEGLDYVDSFVLKRDIAFRMKFGGTL